MLRVLGSRLACVWAADWAISGRRQGGPERILGPKVQNGCAFVLLKATMDLDPFSAFCNIVLLEVCAARCQGFIILRVQVPIIDLTFRIKVSNKPIYTHVCIYRQMYAHFLTHIHAHVHIQTHLHMHSLSSYSTYVYYIIYIYIDIQYRYIHITWKGFDPGKSAAPSTPRVPEQPRLQSQVVATNLLLEAWQSQA